MIYNYCTHCYADPDDNYGIDGEIEASNIEEVKHFVEKELELELPLESYWIESEDGSEYYHSPDLITNYPPKD